MTPDTTPGSQFLSFLLSSPWLRPLNDLDAIDDLVGRFDATWSIRRTKARVVAVVRETAEVRTLVLKPNRLWPGHAAGQHVLVEVEVDGRRLCRTFTISSAPRKDGTIDITVKRRVGGKVSAWWNERASVGVVLGLGRPAGDFVMPAGKQHRVTMLSAGSGITPVMAILRDLRAHSPDTSVRFVHCARSREDVIFRDELEELARQWANLELTLHFTGTEGRFGAAALARLAQRAGNDLAFVCGPDGFLEAARRAWRQAGNEDTFRAEHFGLPRSITAGDGSTSQLVHAARAGVSFVAAGGRSLLAEAEAAGLEPMYGCRMGICHTCKCRKVSGVVEDLRDGRVSEERDAMIQLCVTAARSAVTLDL